ncbi:hypothetical protein EVAR_66280_1 [Eumeta japonica]|uniref:RNA-directed DNA polymerase n=1 Tax=Eumeta variegata TaxID=151549 RepID=A0A4C1YUC4_EUMVA|nr:hypothetical protein EVAR_66280_1 [Eumeta japonica]
MRLQGEKHTAQSLMAADGCPNAPDRLFVADRRTKMQFLVDTGSEIYILPRSAVQQQRTKTTYHLSAANRTTINTYGYINQELDLSLRQDYPWRFVVADVTKPIIEADFLQFYNLMVDIRNRRIIDNTTTLSTLGLEAISSSISSVKILLSDPRYNKLLAKYPNITRPSGIDNVTLLGYSISAKGTKLLEQKLDSIKNFPTPKTAKELRRFLGMINFYRRFIPVAARIQVPLNALFTGLIKNSHPVNIIGETLKAFDTCKDSLGHAFLLAHPDYNMKLSFITDDSDTSLGALLQQYKDRAWEFLAFYSHKLNPAQQDYSPYARELLAICEAIKYFRHMLEVRDFLTYTDNKPHAHPHNTTILTSYLNFLRISRIERPNNVVDFLKLANT